MLLAPACDRQTVEQDRQGVIDERCVDVAPPPWRMP
jgi:hypothetical protein